MFSGMSMFNKCLVSGIFKKFEERQQHGGVGNSGTLSLLQPQQNYN